MGCGGLKPVANIDSITFLIPALNEGRIQLFCKRSSSDHHQGRARQIPEIGGKLPVSCLLKAIHHINIPVIVKNTVVGGIEEHKVCRLGHGKELTVICVKYSGPLKKIAVPLCDN